MTTLVEQLQEEILDLMPQTDNNKYLISKKRRDIAKAMQEELKRLKNL